MAIAQEFQLCNECGTQLTETLSDYVCPNCGLVAAPRLVESSFFINQDEKTGYSSHSIAENVKASLLNTKGSFIGFYSNWNISDIQGKRINLNGIQQFKRLKRINDIYSQSQGKERLYRALKLLSGVSGVLELPNSIKDDAARIFRNSYEKLPEIRIVDLVAASLYLATRLNGYNLRVKDLLSSFQSENADVLGKHVLFAATQIRIIGGYRIRSTTSEEYLERIIQALINDQEFQLKLYKLHISNLEFGILIRKTSQELLKLLSRDIRGGRDPYVLACATVAGADLLIAKKFGKNRGFATQRLIARVSNVAEYTLREHFLQIVKLIL